MILYSTMLIGVLVLHVNIGGHLCDHTAYLFSWAIDPPSQPRDAMRDGLVFEPTDSYRSSGKTGSPAQSTSDSRYRFGSTRAISIVREKKTTWRVQSFAHLLSRVKDKVEFSIVLRHDNIQEFDGRWDEILLSMEQFPPDDILESLYTLRIRESEKLGTVSELYNLEIHQKKAEPDYHKLKTMEKRSIEQDFRSRNVEARIGRVESNMLVKIQWEQRRVHKDKEIVGSGKPKGSFRKETITVFWHDTKNRAKPTAPPSLSPEPSTAQDGKNSAKAKGPRGRSPPDHLEGTCANPSCEEWRFPEWLFCKSKEGWNFGEKCSFAHRRVEEQPRTRSNRNDDKSTVAMLKETKNLNCVFQEVEPPRSSSILRKSSTTTKPIRCVRFTTEVLRNAKLRDQNPSLNKICHGDSHQRSPNAPKFEDRSQEQTEWQEHCVREFSFGSGQSKSWSWRRNIELHSSHPRKSGVSLHHPKLNQKKEHLWYTPARRCTW